MRFFSFTDVYFFTLFLGHYGRLPYKSSTFSPTAGSIRCFDNLVVVVVGGETLLKIGCTKVLVLIL